MPASSFPNSLDFFRIKNPGEIEDAEDINLYHDAITKIQPKAVFVGGASVSAVGTGGILNGELLMAREIKTLSLTGFTGSGTITGTVPSGIGNITDPQVYLWWTPYVTPPGSAVAGSWAGKSSNATNGIFNEVLRASQPAVSFRPTSPNTYEIRVQMVDPALEFIPPGTIGLCNWDDKNLDVFNDEDGIEVWDTRSENRNSTNKNVLCLLGNKGGGCRLFKVTKGAVDLEIEFELYGVAYGAPNWLMGPVLRYKNTGSSYAKSASFYMLNLVAGYGPSYKGSIVRCEDYSNLKSRTSSVGTMAVIASGFAVNSKSQTGQSVFYKFGVQSLGVDQHLLYLFEKVGAGSWTFVASAVDTSSLSSGFGGFAIGPKTYTGKNYCSAYVDNVTLRIPESNETLKVSLEMMWVRFRTPLGP